MAGISSSALSFGGAENKKGFNGNEIQSKEFGNGSGLDLYDFNARTFDQQIGRFTQLDPLLEKYQEDLTPYQYSYNNPLRFNDPNGKCPTCPDDTYVPIADHVYDAELGDVSSNGWEVIRVDENTKTGFKGALYRGQFNGMTEYIYATAGTQDMKDATEDVKQLRGDSKQYKQSVDIANQLQKDYQGVSFTGHSLGGGLASANALKVQGKAVTFNAAGISGATRRNLSLGNTANITAYVVQGEALDYFQSLMGMKAEGRTHYLPANYIPRIPFLMIDDAFRSYQRGLNHLMDEVLPKFNNHIKK